MCSHRFGTQVRLRSFTHPPLVYVLMLPPAQSLIQQLNKRLLSSEAPRRRRSTHTSPAGSLSCALLRPPPTPHPPLSLSFPSWPTEQHRGRERWELGRKKAMESEGMSWFAQERNGEAASLTGAITVCSSACACARLCVGGQEWMWTKGTCTPSSITPRTDEHRLLARGAKHERQDVNCRVE